jgi:sugar/nucleoside kinase (ribokinase family)
MTTRAPHILCAGITVIDHVFRVERFPQANTKTRAKDFRAVTGGCAANAAVAAARLGGRVRLATPLGDAADPLSNDIVRRLEVEQVDCSPAVRVAGATAPISAILVDASGERLIVNRRDDMLARAQLPDPGGLIADADAVLIDNRFSYFVLPVAQAARQRGIPVLLDGDEPTDGSEAVLGAVSHIVFSADGLRATAQCADLADGLRIVQERTKAQLAVSNGAEGALWLDAGRLERIPAFPVEAVDTLGAGDVFHGACVLALAEGRNFPEAMRFAAAAAALKCLHFGGIAGAPGRAETERFLARIGGEAGT